MSFLTDGLPVGTTADLIYTPRVPVDTYKTSGAYPQQVGMPVGLLSGFLNLGTGAAAVTAHVGGGQALATQLDYGITNVTVVATAADSVKLPPAVAGAFCFVKNTDSDSVTVFGYGTDTIDSVASATGNAQAGGKGKLYFAVVGVGDGVAGNWVSLLGA